jgi:Ca2+/H+ antiporter
MLFLWLSTASSESHTWQESQQNQSRYQNKEQRNQHKPLRLGSGWGAGVCVGVVVLMWIDADIVVAVVLAAGCSTLCVDIVAVDADARNIIADDDRWHSYC